VVLHSVDARIVVERGNEAHHDDDGEDAQKDRGEDEPEAVADVARVRTAKSGRCRRIHDDREVTFRQRSGGTRRERKVPSVNSNGSGAGSYLVLAVLVVIMVLTRRGRMNTSNVPLDKGERIRPLLITLLDPVVSLVIIGPIFWHLTTTNVEHLVLAVVGGVIGVGIAWARARVMFVRAVHATKSVILRRSGAEYALLGLLIVLRLVEGSVKHERVGVESLILTGLISLAVCEPIARSTFIVLKYVKHQDVQPPLPESPQ